MIKAVIFDMGGVVLDYSMETACRHLSALLHADRKKLEHAISNELPELDKGKIDKYEFWKRVFLTLGLVYNRKLASSLWLSHYAIKSRMKNDVVKIVVHLKKNGYKTALLSNTIKEHSSYNKKLHRYRFFDVVVLSCNVRMRKPERGIYLIATKKLKVKPHECVFIDNMKINVTGARKAGMKAIWFRNARQLKSDLKRIGINI